MSYKAKAVALISGGLDSMLAVKALQEQGVHVEGLNFYTGFCHSGHTSAIRNNKTNKLIRNDALFVAESLGIKLHIEDIVEPYKEVLLNPQYGYGKHANPCLDCKIFMVKKAYEWMLEHGFDFIVTGEVIGQRPNSQLKAKMPIIAKQSGAYDRLLRPLCAKLLEPTLPEREGWVDREKLFAFNGRNRKPQLQLAASYGFDEFAQPSGGCCVLTDENYTRRLSDMWTHRGTKEYSMEDIILLKTGRHLRINPDLKMIIARDEGEHHFLQGYRKQYLHLEILNERGPIALIEGQPQSEEIKLCASIAARFSSGKQKEKVSFHLHHNKGSLTEMIEVKPLQAEEIPKDWYL